MGMSEGSYIGYNYFGWQIGTNVAATHVRTLSPTVSPRDRVRAASDAEGVRLMAAREPGSTSRVTSAPQGAKIHSLTLVQVGRLTVGLLNALQTMYNTDVSGLVFKTKISPSMWRFLEPFTYEVRTSLSLSRDASLLNLLGYPSTAPLLTGGDAQLWGVLIASFSAVAIMLFGLQLLNADPDGDEVSFVMWVEELSLVGSELHSSNRICYPNPTTFPRPRRRRRSSPTTRKPRSRGCRPATGGASCARSSTRTTTRSPRICRAMTTSGCQGPSDYCGSVCCSSC
jgi:hypothetical protein